jgi:hypothetical protein
MQHLSHLYSVSGALARADALLQLAQAQGAVSRSAPASWVSYADGEAILLAIVLLVVACAFAYAGKRLRAPLWVRQPGGAAAGFMIAIWLLGFIPSVSPRLSMDCK